MNLLYTFILLILALVNFGVLIYNRNVWFVATFGVFGLALMIQSYYFRKDLSFSRRVSSDITRLGFVTELTDVSIVLPPKNMNYFMGIVLDEKYYLPYTVSGDYSVVLNGIGENLMYYRYYIVGTNLKILVVFDCTQNPELGGVRVYSN